ncbi:hypothetical protein VNO78_17554 [Psophocarpus tetragonolobus]|uniref:Cation/H+ exchanger domain-containing protein n=1 Tax=Psophocarpus tetragonolobus TaxID=3891 RepID=A0AAN9SMV9_PSOTE
MALNTSSIRTTSSEGAWQGDNPLSHALPLLIIQIILVLLVSRTLAFVLKPLRQPKVVAEIIVMGVELDLRAISRSGKQALSIAVAGISLPFVLAVGVTFVVRRGIPAESEKNNIGYLEHLIFLGVALSITAFPVLARILAELKLLTTRLGETAMAAAAFNDVAAWVLLALAVALAGQGHKGTLFTSLWVLLSGVAFVAFMMILVRPLMNRVASKCCHEHDVLPDTYICLTLAGVMLSGFVTDMIGIHSIFGGFIFGLTIPKESEFAIRLTRRVEDLVSTLLLPLYFASSGLKTDVTKLQNMLDWALLLLVTSAACVGKIFGTFVAALICTLPVRESLTLGVLMNTKGLVELIVLNIGREKKVLNDEMFTIMVLMAIFTTFITTPVVLAIYKPARIVKSRSEKPSRLADMEEKLRILACIHGPANIPSLINFIHSIRATNKSHLKLYVMQLTELTDTPSSMLMVQHSRKNGFPFLNPFQRGPMHHPIASAFQSYGEVGLVTVHHLTSISLLSTMHEDICHVAEKKRVAMIILPFHMRCAGEHEDLGPGWTQVNLRVLQNSPCSVALQVNLGGGTRYQHGAPTILPAKKRVCIIFIGGPHDRKVLELGTRIAAHPAISLVFVRFTSFREAQHEGESHNSSISTINFEKENELDEEEVNKFKSKCEGSVEFIEKNAVNIKEEVLSILKAKDYELVIVGKQQQLDSSALTMTNTDFHPEHAELGAIGDLFTSSSDGIACSLVVIHDKKLINPNDGALVKSARAKCAAISDTIYEI